MPPNMSSVLAREEVGGSGPPEPHDTTLPFNMSLLRDPALEARMRVRVPIVTTASALAIALGVAGSLLLLLTALQQRRKERIFTTLLLVSLSLACLVYSAVVLVFFVSSYQQFAWLMGRVACKADQYIYYVLNYAIIYQLVLLTCYLVVMIRFPRSWIASQTNNILSCSVFFIIYWIIWHCFNMETIYAYDVIYYPLTGDIFCFPLYRSTLRSSIATCLHSIFRLLIPGVFMVLSTVRLCQSHNFSSVNRKNYNERQSDLSTYGGIIADCRKAAVSVTVSFVLMRGPLDVYNFIDAIDPNMLFTVDITIVIDFLLWLYNVYFVFVPLILVLSFKSTRYTAKMLIMKCPANHGVKGIENRQNSESTHISLAPV